MNIVVSGTPATGKTTTAKLIADNYGYKYVDGKKLIKEHNLIIEHDKELDTNIVDDKKFRSILEDLLKKEQNLVIDSLLAHEVKPEHVQLIIITTCDRKLLVQRMQERGYSDKKIADNLDAENFDTCYVEAQEAGHKNMVKIRTDQDVKKQLTSFLS